MLVWTDDKFMSPAEQTDIWTQTQLESGMMRIMN